MDILFLMKSEHSQLTELMRDLEDSSAQPMQAKLGERLQALAGALRVFISLDRELIYPELGDLVAQDQKVITEGYGHHERMLALLNKVQDEAQALTELGSGQGLGTLAALMTVIRNHLSHQQAQVIPRLRAMIPTQDREDLGQVYLDMKEDLAGSLPPAPAPVSNRREQVG